MNKAIFIDRDNTIIINDDYLADPSKVVLVPHVGPALDQLRMQGFLLITVSNQAMVAHGIGTEEDVERVNAEMRRQLALGGVEIAKCYSCFFHDNPKTKDPTLLEKYWFPNHPDRKPNPGMLLKAAKEFDLDLGQCWMIGDSLKDVEAGIKAGCRTIWIDDPAIKASPDAKKGSENTQPDFKVENWISVPLIIEREGMRGAPISPAGI